MHTVRCSGRLGRRGGDVCPGGSPHRPLRILDPPLEYNLNHAFALFAFRQMDWFATIAILQTFWGQHQWKIAPVSGM